MYKVTDRKVIKKPYPQDSIALKDWLYKNNKHLKSAKELGIYNNVTLIFPVDEKGKTMRPFVLKGIGGPYDGEAIRLFKEQPYLWVPGETKKGPVKVETTYTIYFNQ